MPMLLAPATGWVTPFIAVLGGIGFFGLDEVGEILDSPFGCDANDIDILKDAMLLAEDLDAMWQSVAQDEMRTALHAEEDCRQVEGTKRFERSHNEADNEA